MNEVSREEHRSMSEALLAWIQGERGGVVEKESESAARIGDREGALGSNKSGQMGRGVQ